MLKFKQIHKTILYKSIVGLRSMHLGLSKYYLSRNYYLAPQNGIMKIISFNVNGIRAIAKKNFFEDVIVMAPDILCLQETKAQDIQVAETLAPIDGYHIYSNSAEKKGYSGTSILSKIKALSVSTDMGIPDHDMEGRIICLEFEGFFLVNVYVPNSGSELKRLDYRQDWDKAFYDYLKNLEWIKPVIVCGDFNVAHKAIDLARPKQNYNKSAGWSTLAYYAGVNKD